MTIKINVLLVKNSFLTETADAKTRYKAQYTSQHVRKTNKYIKSLKCLLASTCFVFLFNFTNLELAAILKTTTKKRRGFIDMPLACVTYGKYATRVPDVVTYGLYEYFSSLYNISSAKSAM